MTRCVVIVYENGTVKRTILVEGDEGTKTGKTAERVFRDTISEEIGQELGNDFSEEDVADALEEGRIEVNGGQTEIYICWPERTVQAG